MTKKDTLLKKAQQNPGGLRFDELIRLAGILEWEKKPGGGTSHQSFKKKGESIILTFQPGPDGKAKAYQVKQLLGTIKGESETEEGGTDEHS